MTTTDDTTEMLTEEARHFGVYLARQEINHCERRRRNIEKRFGEDADYSRVEVMEKRVRRFIRWIKGNLDEPTGHEHTRRLVALTYNEALSLHSLTRWRRRKAERQLAKSTFVPEPGHAHAGEIGVEKARALEEHMMSFLEGFPEFDPTEWVDDDEADE